MSNDEAALYISSRVYIRAAFVLTFGHDTEHIGWFIDDQFPQGDRGTKYMVPGCTYEILYASAYVVLVIVHCRLVKTRPVGRESRVPDDNCLKEPGERGILRDIPNMEHH